MRHVIAALATVVALSAHAVDEPTQAQRDFVTYLVKSGKEPKVKDATWMGRNNLYIGVIDDRTPRDGFADYICSVAADRGLTPDLVKIVDIVKVVRTGKFVELGKSRCR